MKNKEKVIDELMVAILQGVQKPVRMFSIGRNILTSLPHDVSVRDIVDQNLINAFNQENVQYLGSLSTDDELVFFYMKEDIISLNGEKKIVSYIYDQVQGCIVVTIID